MIRQTETGSSPGRPTTGRQPADDFSMNLRLRWLEAELVEWWLSEGDLRISVNLFGLGFLRLHARSSLDLAQGHGDDGAF